MTNRIPPTTNGALTGDRPAANLQQPAPIDPIDAANHLWALRLWIVCALIIVTYAIGNYLLHWFI